MGTYGWCVGDEDVGVRRHLAQPGLGAWRVLEAVLTAEDAAC